MLSSKNDSTFQARLETWRDRSWSHYESAAVLNTVAYKLFSILFYLLWKTGLHGDDFSEISNAKNVKSYNDFLKYGWTYIYGPINYLIL